MRIPGPAKYPIRPVPPLGVIDPGTWDKNPSKALLYLCDELNKLARTHPVRRKACSILEETQLFISQLHHVPNMKVRISLLHMFARDLKVRYPLNDMLIVNLTHNVAQTFIKRALEQWKSPLKIAA